MSCSDQRRLRKACLERDGQPDSRRIRVGWLAVASLAVVLGSACSGTDPGSGTTDAPPALGTATEAAAIDLLPESNPPRDEAPSSAGAASDGESSSPEDGSSGDSGDGFTPYEERVYPLGAFLNDLRSEVFGDQDFFDPMGSIEDLKHACMTGQGFRYGKIDWAAIDAEFEAATPSLAEEDYIPTGGYGFADSLDAPETTESSYVDPNEEIKAGLTAPELAAWEQQRRECARRAQDEVLGRAGVIRWALRDDFDALDERITADPRLAEAAREWSACMAGFGHHYADRAEIFDYLARIADPLQERLRALGGHDRIDAAFQADLDALLAIEIEIAVADLACKKPLEQTEYEVRVEHEQRFLDDNQDRLALLRDELPTMTMPPGVFSVFS